MYQLETLANVQDVSCKKGVKLVDFLDSSWKETTKSKPFENFNSCCELSLWFLVLARWVESWS